MGKTAPHIVQTEYKFGEDLESIKTAALVTMARTLLEIDRSLKQIAHNVANTRYRTEEKAKLARKIVRLQNQIKKGAK